MALSHQERRTLAEIERGLQSDDPTLAGRMTGATVTADRWQPHRWAWFGLLLGLQVTLVGFAAAGGPISIGMIVGLYGLLLLGSSAVSLWCGLRQRRAGRILRRGRH
jgi:hypothetical protein